MTHSSRQAWMTVEYAPESNHSGARTLLPEGYLNNDDPQIQLAVKLIATAPEQRKVTHVLEQAIRAYCKDKRDMFESAITRDTQQGLLRVTETRNNSFWNPDPANRAQLRNEIDRMEDKYRASMLDFKETLLKQLDQDAADLIFRYNRDLDGIVASIVAGNFSMDELLRLVKRLHTNLELV